jgi:O-succinylbenzoic acid--CoA ligase
MPHTLTRVTGREVRPLPVAPGERVLDLLPVLADALDGRGPAWLPVPVAGPVHGSVHGSVDAGRLIGPLAADEDDDADPTAFVLSTSGSTGDPKGALLPVSALRASAGAAHERLGGPGTWLLALPAEHIAGLQVLLRSALAGTSPVVMNLREGFSPKGFVVATDELSLQASPFRRYTSLVPTQLSRLLDDGGDAIEALTTYDAVLVGGAATSPTLLERAEASGVAVITTYGASETCGGCVYDGRSLSGVWWRTEEDGRVELSGPVVARGYRGRPGDPAFRADADGTRWFRTDDIGEASLDGSLRILGRVDEVIVTGGLKVAPALVEAALADCPGVRHVVVVGVPDEAWGERVVAVVVPERATADQRASADLRPSSASTTGPQLADLHQAVADRIASYAAPRQLVVVDAIPLIGPGKPDRAALRTLASRSQAGR